MINTEQQVRILKRASVILDQYFLTKRADTSDTTTMEKVALNRMAKILRDGLLARSFDGAKQTLQLSDDALLRVTQRSKRTLGSMTPKTLRHILTPPLRGLDTRMRYAIDGTLQPTEIPKYTPWVSYLRTAASDTGDKKIINNMHRITSLDIARRMIRGHNKLTPSVLDDKARIVRHMANRLAHHVNKLTPSDRAIAYASDIDNPTGGHTVYSPVSLMPEAINLPSAASGATPRERAQTAFHELLEALALKRLAKLRLKPDKAYAFSRGIDTQYLRNQYPFSQYLQVSNHTSPSVVILENMLGARHGGDTASNFRSELIDITNQIRDRQFVPFSGTASSAADLYKQIATNEKTLADKIHKAYFDNISQYRAIVRSMQRHLNLGLSPKDRLPNPTSYSESEIPFPEVYDELAQYRLRNKIRTADNKISHFL